MRSSFDAADRSVALNYDDTVGWKCSQPDCIDLNFTRWLDFSETTYKSLRQSGRDTFSIDRPEVAYPVEKLVICMPTNFGKILIHIESAAASCSLDH